MSLPSYTLIISPLDKPCFDTLYNFKPLVPILLLNVSSNIQTFNEFVPLRIKSISVVDELGYVKQ